MSASPSSIIASSSADMCSIPSPDSMIAACDAAGRCDIWELGRKSGSHSLSLPLPPCHSTPDPLPDPFPFRET